MAYGSQAAFMFAFILGFVPMMLLLYYTLKDYEDYFEDKQLFFALLIALFLGTLGAVFHIGIGITYNIVEVMIIIVGVAIFENIVKVTVLKLKRYGKKYDTTYYGVSFGLGFGAMIVVGKSYEYFLYPPPDVGVTVGGVIGLILFAVTVSLLHGALGPWIGYGIYQDDLLRYVSIAVMIQIPINFLLFLWYAVDEWPLMAVTGLCAFALYRYVFQNILSKALPPDLKKHRRRAIRRKKRGG